MNLNASEVLTPISQADQDELTTLLNAVALSDRALTVFAIAPESAPNHPVVQQLQHQLSQLEEPLAVLPPFFYSDDAFYNFLHRLDKSPTTSERGRRVVMAFGLDQLPLHRLKREMEQLNLGRETIFAHDLIVIFWLSRASFLEEFRRRAADFWDWRGKVVTFDTRPPLHPLLYPYLESLITENSYLKFSGIMQVNRQVDIFLDQIYVSLQAERRQTITETTISAQPDRGRSFRSSKGLARSLDAEFGSLGAMDDGRLETTLEVETRSTKTVTQKVNVYDVIKQHQYAVVLGAPGAGKTTLLRYLALHFAQAKRDGQETVPGGMEAENLGAALLPIYVRIADYAERLEQQPVLSLADYVEQFYQPWKDSFDGDTVNALSATQDAKSHAETPQAETAEASRLFLQQLRQGNCLILLDGLDEVFDQDSRRQIVKRIDQFVEMFGANRFVVTSRIAGYRDVRLGDRFAEFTITDMTDAQVELFLQRWCRAIEQVQQPDAPEHQLQREAEQQARLILAAIQHNEGVKRLTANPLLLTILALIHRNGERLPERRVKLYELAVQTLTADWQLSKKLPNAQKVLLPEGEVVALLAPLAYWMHEEKPSGLVTEAEVKQQLTPKLAELRGEDPDSDTVQQAVDEFLRRVRETTGLFVERAPNVYGFMHLTFEEYFAALHIADNDLDKVAEIITDHLDDPRWDEPNILALSFIATHSPKQFNKLLEDLFSPILELGDLWQQKWQQKWLNFLQKMLNQNIGSMLLGTILLFSISYLSNFSFKSFSSIQNYFRLYEFQLKVISEIEIIGGLRLRLIQNLLLITCLTYFYWSKNQIHANVSQQITNIVSNKRVLKLVASLKLIASNESISIWIRSIVSILGNFELTDKICSLATMTKEVVSNKSGTNAEILRTESLKYLQSIISSSEFNSQIKVAAQEILIDVLFADFLGQVKSDSSKHQLLKNSLNGLISTLPEQNIPIAYIQIANKYKELERYQEASLYHQYAIEIYKQFEQKESIAGQWYALVDCYRSWGKYEQALDAAEHLLRIRQQLEDQAGIAVAYWQFGNVYEGWGKYAQAVSYYEQSRDLWQELKREEVVGNLWYALVNCYRSWGKYEQALDAAEHLLRIRQQLEDQAGIAVAYWQFGNVYEGWGKYAQAVSYYEQSRDLWQELKREEVVGNLWYALVNCYRSWGKYEQALDAAEHLLRIRQQLEDQVGIAVAYWQFGNVYEGWGKYKQAIGYYEQSRDLCAQLELNQNVANRWARLAACYRDLKQYAKALECYQRSVDLYQSLDQSEHIATQWRRIGYTQCLMVKETLTGQAALDLLAEAEQTIQQAIQQHITGDYQDSLAYDRTALALIYAERLRHLPPDDSSIPTLKNQFEESYTAGCTALAELGQSVDEAEEKLDIARAYLEVNALQNLDQAEALAQASLQVFQTYHRRKLEAAALKLLGEIDPARADAGQQAANATGIEYLQKSLQLYRDLDLVEKASEVEQLLQ